jgi:hypothetical protein
LRNSYILDIRKLPAKAAGYCYGKRILMLISNSLGPFGKIFMIQECSSRRWHYCSLS